MVRLNWRPLELRSLSIEGLCQGAVVFMMRFGAERPGGRIARGKRLLARFVDDVGGRVVACVESGAFGYSSHREVLRRTSAAGSPGGTLPLLASPRGEISSRRDESPWRLGRTTVMRASARARAFQGLFFTLLAFAGACARTEPSRTPLSPPPSEPGRARPSSSRAVEAWEQPEERDEVEVVVTPSDDDDDSTKRAASPKIASAAGAKGSVPPAACSVPAGAPPDCAQLPAASSCLGAALSRRACETLGPAVDPRVGAAWLSCMRDPASGSPCDAHRIVACGLRAVEHACVDGSYRSLCTEVAATCADMADEITAPVCERLIGAWKPERRPQMIECLRHGCETGGFGACLP